MTSSDETAEGPRGRVLGIAAACAGVAALVVWWGGGGASGGAREHAPPAARAAPAPDGGAEAGTRLLGRVPTAFIPNLGQWDHSARFVARFGAMTVLLEERGFWVDVAQRPPSPRDPRSMLADRREQEPTPVRGAALRFTFDGAASATVEGEDRLAGVHNYFLGNDPARWRTDVPRFGAVAMGDLYPGIDVRAYEKDGHFEYDLVLAPGADLAGVEVRVEGVESLRVDRDGALVIETAVGPVRQPRPIAYVVDANGQRAEVACSHELRGRDRFGFVAESWGGEGELVVDPGLVWSTFLGGSGDESASVVSVDAAGTATVAGSTASSNFPVTPGAFDTHYDGLWDAFVARLSLNGSTLIYSTYLGGGSAVRALVVDAQGTITVAGRTTSNTFPTTAGAFDTTHNGGSDAFVTRLSPTGTSLVYSTYLGGIGGDWAYALAVDANGAVTVAGATGSFDFPTTLGAFDMSYNGGVDHADVFVARLSPLAVSLVYSTFLGGASNDYALGLALDAQGTATVVGTTGSSGFPTTPGAFDTSFNGSGNSTSDAFITKLSSTGSTLIYSTFLGGGSYDSASAVALDAQGSATVVGGTDSPDFPTTPGAFDTIFNGGDAFVTRLSATGASLVFSTFLGGARGDGADALALDMLGAVTIAGQTESTDFPTTPGAFDTSLNGGGDVFVARLSPSGMRLDYSTYLGGSRADHVHALALEAQGTATIVGDTDSTDLLTTLGAFDTIHNGGLDAFVTRLDMLPTGARTFGTSSVGCTGSLPIGVTSMPSIGNATFTTTCGNAPRNAAGVLLVAPRGLASPIRVLGVDVWIDPAGAWFLAPPTTSNGMGAAYFAMPIPQNLDLIGRQFCVQFGWAGPSSPLPCPPMGVSASNAIEITIQQ